MFAPSPWPFESESGILEDVWREAWQKPQLQPQRPHPQAQPSVQTASSTSQAAWTAQHSPQQAPPQQQPPPNPAWQQHAGGQQQPSGGQQQQQPTDWHQHPSGQQQQQHPSGQPHQHPAAHPHAPHPQHQQEPQRSQAHERCEEEALCGHEPESHQAQRPAVRPRRSMELGPSAQPSQRQQHPGSGPNGLVSRQSMPESVCSRAGTPAAPAFSPPGSEGWDAPGPGTRASCPGSALGPLAGFGSDLPVTYGHTERDTHSFTDLGPGPGRRALQPPPRPMSQPRLYLEGQEQEPAVAPPSHRPQWHRSVSGNAQAFSQLPSSALSYNGSRSHSGARAASPSPPPDERALCTQPPLLRTLGGMPNGVGLVAPPTAGFLNMGGRPSRKRFHSERAIAPGRLGLNTRLQLGEPAPGEVRSAHNSSSHSWIAGRVGALSEGHSAPQELQVDTEEDDDLPELRAGVSRADARRSALMALASPLDGPGPGPSRFAPGAGGPGPGSQPGTWTPPGMRRRAAQSYDGLARRGTSVSGQGPVGPQPVAVGSMLAGSRFGGPGGGPAGAMSDGDRPRLVSLVRWMDGADAGGGTSTNGSQPTSGALTPGCLSAEVDVPSEAWPSGPPRPALADERAARRTWSHSGLSSAPNYTAPASLQPPSPPQPQQKWYPSSGPLDDQPPSPEGVHRTYSLPASDPYGSGPQATLNIASGPIPVLAPPDGTGLGRAVAVSGSGAWPQRMAGPNGGPQRAAQPSAAPADAGRGAPTELPGQQLFQARAMAAGQSTDPQSLAAHQGPQRGLPRGDWAPPDSPQWEPAQHLQSHQHPHPHPLGDAHPDHGHGPDVHDQHSNHFNNPNHHTHQHHTHHHDHAASWDMTYSDHVSPMALDDGDDGPGPASFGHWGGPGTGTASGAFGPGSGGFGPGSGGFGPGPASFEQWGRQGLSGAADRLHPGQSHAHGQGYGQGHGQNQGQGQGQVNGRTSGTGQGGPAAPTHMDGVEARAPSPPQGPGSAPQGGPGQAQGSGGRSGSAHSGDMSTRSEQQPWPQRGRNDDGAVGAGAQGEAWGAGVRVPGRGRFETSMNCGPAPAPASGPAPGPAGAAPVHVGGSMGPMQGLRRGSEQSVQGPYAQGAGASGSWSGFGGPQGHSQQQPPQQHQHQQPPQQHQQPPQQHQQPLQQHQQRQVMSLQRGPGRPVVINVDMLRAMRAMQADED
ncbi:hypothetical protein HYH03_004044 [Edaphochlamys debaryana]|uniref:Uncharacterized protein n=1 Tax=Edaphochlamys debaryana TaxID=47281 RepID=A0A836C3G1_9CHLO|nr:hypothetical protein HYH03_004044 [Edaphochlamys debaryana]|eukprot:KAG2497772.1 hypothetical protein HYH03_004044 [Edaphochlamys debaryana]